MRTNINTVHMSILPDCECLDLGLGRSGREQRGRPSLVSTSTPPVSTSTSSSSGMLNTS